MASTLPPYNGVFGAGFWDSFQREFLNIMSFGYLDDDNAGVFAADVGIDGSGGGGYGVGDATSETVVKAAGRTANQEGLSAARGVGNVFTYITSPWAVMCLFMVCASSISSLLIVSLKALRMCSALFFGFT